MYVSDLREALLVIGKHVYRLNTKRTRSSVTRARAIGFLNHMHRLWMAIAAGEVFIPSNAMLAVPEQGQNASATLMNLLLNTVILHIQIE